MTKPFQLADIFVQVGRGLVNNKSNVDNKWENEESDKSNRKISKIICTFVVTWKTHIFAVKSTSTTIVIPSGNSYLR